MLAPLNVYPVKSKGYLTGVNPIPLGADPFPFIQRPGGSEAELGSRTTALGIGPSC